MALDTLTLWIMRQRVGGAFELWQEGEPLDQVNWPTEFAAGLDYIAAQNRLLQDQLALIIANGSGRFTSLSSGAAASGSPVSLAVVSSAGFAAGQSVYISEADGSEVEAKIISSVTDATHIVVPSLTNTYSAGASVTVSPVEIVEARGAFATLGERMTSIGGRVFDAAEYGAVGDGITDDSGAISDAITAANAAGGGTVALAPNTTYLIEAGIILKDNVEVRGAGPSTIIKADYDGAAFAALGTLASGHLLASNAVVGDTVVAVAAGGGASYATGDWVVIQSDADAQGVAGNMKGELYRVLSVTGDNVTVEGALLDSYATADAARIKKLTPVTGVTVRDLAVFNDLYNSATTTPTSALVYLEGTINALVSGCTLGPSNGVGVAVLNSYGTRVLGNSLDSLRDDLANSIFGYGVLVSNTSRGSVIANNSIRRVRHGVTTDNSAGTIAAGHGTPRGIVISGNFISDTTHAGIDTHEDGNGISITGNTLIGCAEVGIQVRCYNVSISGNMIVRTRGVGIYVRPLSKQTVITGNLIFGTALSPSATQGYGMQIDSDNVEVSGNLVEESAKHGIYVSTNANQGVNINGNTCKNNGQAAASTYDGINLDLPAGTTRHSVNGNSCVDTQVSKTQRYGLRIESGYNNNSGTGLLVIGNDFSQNETGPYSNAGTGSILSRGNMPNTAPGHEVRVKQTTGSVNAASAADVAVSLPYTLGSTNYVVTAVCEEATGALTVRAIKSKTSSTVTITVFNNDSGSARTGTLHVTAIVDA